MTPPAKPPLPPRKLDFLAAALSYLIPGLGQIYQGRVAKGVMFLVCLYVLFFYGMYLGSGYQDNPDDAKQPRFVFGKNVYLPDSDTRQNVLVSVKPLGDLENRPHFVGQFFIGMAAWPAILQYSQYKENDPDPPLGGWMRSPKESDLNKYQREGDKRWDLGWVYTVIAGALNVLVIYDALAGPAHREAPKKTPAQKEPVAA